MKKALCLLVVLTMTIVVCAPASVLADPPSLASQTISASGSLASETSLSVSLLNDSGGDGLTFNSDGSNLAVTAPEIVRVEFTDNTAGFQSIIVSTDNRDASANPRFTGAAILTGAGLVGVNDTTAAAPLHWVVFETQGEASGYTFSTFSGGADAGKIDNTNQFFVVDRSQSDFDTADVLGYASVFIGLAGQTASLANAPYDDDGPGNQDPNNQRVVNNGTGYMKFAVDYNGQQADTYRTSTLTLDLVTAA